MTKTAIGFPHGDSSEERRWKGLNSHHANFSNELFRARKHWKEAAHQIQDEMYRQHKEVLTEFKEVRDSLDYLEKAHHKTQVILRSWKEKDDD